MGNFFNKEQEQETIYIPYYTVFNIKEQEQDIDTVPECIPLKKKNSYYTTVCKSYDAIKQHGIELLK